MEYLQSYDSSDDEEEEEPPASSHNEQAATPAAKLVLPSSIAGMFPQEKHRDDPSLHQGRVRGFEHVRGIWAGLIGIEITEVPEEWSVLLAEGLQPCAPPLHISLSRPLQLQHHWIDTLLKDLRENAEKIPPFQVHFGGSQVLINDDRTRTFVAVKAIGSGLDAARAICDSAVSCFRLPTFYSDHQYHVSIAWALGDQKSRLENVPSPAAVPPILVRNLTVNAGKLTFQVPLGKPKL